VTDGEMLKIRFLWFRTQPFAEDTTNEWTNERTNERTNKQAKNKSTNQQQTKTN